LTEQSNTNLSRGLLSCDAV